MKPMNDQTIENPAEQQKYRDTHEHEGYGICCTVCGCRHHVLPDRTMATMSFNIARGEWETAGIPKGAQ